jgi:hypothetical protein
MAPRATKKAGASENAGEESAVRPLRPQIDPQAGDEEWQPDSRREQQALPPGGR